MIRESTSEDRLLRGQLIARFERIPWTRKHTGLLALLVSGTFIDGYDVLVIGSALPVISTSLNLSLVQAGWVVSGANGGAIIGSVLAGMTADRFGRRTVFVSACAIMGVFALVAAMTHSPGQLYWARFLQGIGIGAEVPIAAALINELLPTSNRGRMVLVYESAFGWGGIAAPIIAVVLVNTVSSDTAWRLLFAVGGLSLWVLFAWKKLLPESPRWQIERGKLRQAEKTVAEFEFCAQRLGRALADPVIALAPREIEQSSHWKTLLELLSPEFRLRTATNWIMWIAASSYSYGIYVLLTTLYVKVGGLPVGYALYLTLAASLVATLTFYIVGALFDRIGRKPTCAGGLIWSGAIMVAGAIVWSTLHQTSWPTLFVIGVLALIGIVPVSGGGYAYTPEQFPTRIRAWALASCTAWIRVTAVVMPIIVTTIIASGLSITGMFWISAVPLLIGGICVARFGIETKGLRLEEIAR